MPLVSHAFLCLALAGSEDLCLASPRVEGPCLRSGGKDPDTSVVRSSRCVRAPCPYQYPSTSTNPYNSKKSNWWCKKTLKIQKSMLAGVYINILNLSLILNLHF